MKVEVWSDIACPFCYIGKQHFEAARSSFPYADKLRVTWRAFELDPNAPARSPLTIPQMLAKKYGMTENRARQMNQNVAGQGALVGIRFDFEHAVLANTFDAHRLAKYAQAQGRESVLAKLFAAYFELGLCVSDHDVLVQIAESEGLSGTDCRKMLASDAYTQEVRADEAQAQEFGLSGVPAFVIADKFLVSGAQPVATFQEALMTAWQESEADAHS